jgi:hypothetical protein
VDPGGFARQVLLLKTPVAEPTGGVKSVEAARRGRVTKGGFGYGQSSRRLSSRMRHLVTALAGEGALALQYATYPTVEGGPIPDPAQVTHAVGFVGWYYCCWVCVEHSRQRMDICMVI